MSNKLFVIHGWFMTRDKIHDSYLVSTFFLFSNLKDGCTSKWCIPLFVRYVFYCFYVTWHLLFTTSLLIFVLSLIHRSILCTLKFVLPVSFGVSLLKFPEFELTNLFFRLPLFCRLVRICPFFLRHYLPWHPKCQVTFLNLKMRL